VGANTLRFLIALDKSSDVPVGGCRARISFAFDIAYLQQVALRVGAYPGGTGVSARWFRRSHVKKNRSADKKKEQKLQKYVPPALVDYGSVTKITATAKATTGNDNPGSSKMGSCL
jgi:hypothetical protein